MAGIPPERVRLLIRRLLRRARTDRCGFTYIETLVLVLIVTLAAALILALIGVGVTYSKMVTYGNRAVSDAQVYGQVDQVTDSYTTLATKSGLDAGRLTCSWNAQYFDAATGKLAFRQPFTYTVQYSCTIPGLGSTVAIPLKYVGSGISEVFWK